VLRMRGRTKGEVGRGEGGGGGRKGGGERRRTAEFHSSQIIPPYLFPRKKFLFSTPAFLCFLNAPSHLPCRSRPTGRPRPPLRRPKWPVIQHARG
jgi:hypothetical protein